MDNPAPLKISMNFYSDWIHILVSEMENMGYKLATNLCNHDIAIQYFNICKRLIEPLPRKVFISKEYSCPEKFIDAVNLIKEKAINGDNLNTHLHKKIESNPR